jgi:hypothetical protein
MSTIEYDTNFAIVSVFMAMMGLGIGMVMQNLVLVVQNSVDVSVVGAASSSVAFFRSLGGTIGVSVMGAVLGTKVSGYITDGLTDAGVDPSALGSGESTTSIPDLSTVPGPIRTIIESAYGQGVADVFLIAAPLAIITIVFVCLLPNVELGTKSGIQRAAAAGSGGGAVPVTGTTGTIIATGAAEVAGHPVSDDERSETPASSSLVEEKDVAADR